MLLVHHPFGACWQSSNMKGVEREFLSPVEVSVETLLTYIFWPRIHGCGVGELESEHF